MKAPHEHRYPGEVSKAPGTPFPGGIVKWCALCGVHKPQAGGTIRHVLGGRHWVCSKHVTKAVTKPVTQETPKRPVNCGASFCSCIECLHDPVTIKGAP